MLYDYIEKLPATALERYIKKLKVVGLEKCPYQHPADLWCNRPKEWPKLEYPDVYHYLINSPGVFTSSVMANYRSLEAYNFFVSGWVQTVYHKKTTTNHVIFRANVKPSYRVTEQPPHPWVVVSKEASVLAAHCDCMAGLGETCSHIAAVLFKIEAAVRLGYTSSACTEEPCRWNACFTQKIDGAATSKIMFYKTEVKDRLKQKHSRRFRRGDSSTSGPDPDDRIEFLSSLSQASETAVGLSSFTAYAENFAMKQKVPAKIGLPPRLCTMYKSEHGALSATEIKDMCMKQSLPAITVEQCAFVVNVTQAQSSCLVWHEQRAGRITASSAHTVLRARDTPPTSLIKRICTSYPTPLNTPAVTWGRDHESTSFALYSQHMTLAASTMHQSCSTMKTGLHISQQKPYLAASPDGLVECACCGKGVVEIKCPYKHRDIPISVAIQSNDFCIDKEMTIKENHQYFTQVQMQMYVCDVQYADFVVWTTVDCVVLRITRDIEFIAKMILTLEAFWRNAVLLELLTRNLEMGINQENATALVTQATPPQPTISAVYCVCRSSDDSGDMVACDRCNQWFHLRCLKLTRLPKSKTWYCIVCRRS